MVLFLSADFRQSESCPKFQNFSVTAISFSRFFLNLSINMISFKSKSWVLLAIVIGSIFNLYNRAVSTDRIADFNKVIKECFLVYTSVIKYTSP
jgi:hypothetical protein